MDECFTTTSGRVRVWFDESTRLVEIAYSRNVRVDEADARAVTSVISHRMGDAPVRILMDCDGLLDTDVGWRRLWADFFRARGWRDAIAWCGMSQLICVTAFMFLNSTGVLGRPFRTEREAREWVLAQRTS